MARVGFRGLAGAEAKKNTVTLLDEGWYRGKVVECEYKELGENKTPCLNYKAEVDTEVLQQDGGSSLGRFSYGTVWLPKDDDDDKKYENKLNNLKMFLQITETPMDGDDFDDSKVVGGQLAFKVVHEADKKGKIRAKIDDFDPYDAH